MSELTLEQRAACYEHTRHIMRVRDLLNRVVVEILTRADSRPCPQWDLVDLAVALSERMESVCGRGVDETMERMSLSLARWDAADDAQLRDILQASVRRLLTNDLPTGHDADWPAIEDWAGNADMRLAWVGLLLRAGERHDLSKLESPEVEAFTVVLPQLSKLVYGTAEYDEQRWRLGPALKHHYAHNRHHPEHHRRGINDMDLVDVIEMLCDWQAAGERHADGGDLWRSIRVNTDRFNIKPALQRVLLNTVPLLSAK